LSASGGAGGISDASAALLAEEGAGVDALALALWAFNFNTHGWVRVAHTEKQPGTVAAKYQQGVYNTAV
jgi:hypothetical protein